VVVLAMTVCMTVMQAMRVAAVVMCIREQGQQSDGCNTQQQHRKLGPARKGLGDVSPAAAAAQQAASAQQLTTPKYPETQSCSALLCLVLGPAVAMKPLSYMFDRTWQISTATGKQ
jgi:hypothetical protein